jgi:hypothetical protein
LVGYDDFLRGPVTPSAAWRLERGLARTLWELGRRLVELAFHQLEPAEVRSLPARLEVGGVWYRRNCQRPRRVFCLFGPLTLRRVLYQSVEIGLAGICPLEQALGIVAHLATPALADQVGRLSAELTQQQTRAVLDERYHVPMSVGSLRKVVAALAESLSPLRQEQQVERLLGLLTKAFDSRGKYRPSLVAGRDGVMVQTRPCWEEASTATVTVYDRRGRRLGSVYLGRMPELGQAAMTQQLQDLLTAVLAAWPGPLPRLHYVTDAGSHPLEFYRRVLRGMRHPRSGQRLQWTWSVDYYHAAQRISKLAECLFGVGREASAWAAKMRKTLRDKPGGVGRVLHSAGALRSRLGLTGTKKEYDQAANYLRRFSKHMNYDSYRRQGLPIGSGVTEAACKSIFGYRFKQSGMRWRPATGQHILDLRVILKSGIWRSTYETFLNAYEPPHPPTPATHDQKPLTFPAAYALTA